MKKLRKGTGLPYIYFRKCVICNRQQNPKCNVHLFKLPLDPLRCRLWLEAIGDEELLYVPIEKLHQAKRVCNAHFTPEDFNVNANRLKPTAAPSLNLPQKKIPEHAFRDFPYYVHRDHLHQFNSIPEKSVSGPMKLPIIHENIQTESLENVGELVSEEMPNGESSGNDDGPPPTQTPTAESDVKNLTGDQTYIESQQRANAGIRSQNEDRSGNGVQTEVDINKTGIDKFEDTFDFNICDDNISEHDIGDIYCSLQDDHDYDERIPSTASQFLRNFTVEDIPPNLQAAADLQDYCRSCLSNNALEVPESLSAAFTQATGVSLSDAQYPRRLCCRCAAYVRKFVRFRDASRMAGDMLKELVDRGMVTNSLITSIKAVCSTYLPELEIKHNFTNNFDAEYLHEEEEIKFNTQPSYNIENQNLSLDTFQNNDNYIDYEDDDIFVIQNNLKNDVSQQQNIEPNMINKCPIDITKQGVSLKGRPKIVKLKAVTNKTVINQLREKVKLKIVPFNKELKLCQDPTLIRPLKQHGGQNLNVPNDSLQTQRPRSKITSEEKEKRETQFNDSFEIVTLSFQQQMEDLLKRKETQNYIDAKFKCEFCFKGFMFKKLYLRHLKIHSLGTGPFQCKVCRRRFSSEQNYLSHERSHKIKMRCRICSYETTSRNTAMSHLDWHNDIRYTCDKCGQIFEYISELRAHARIKHPPDCVCGVCGLSFVSQRTVAAHVYFIHKLKNVEIPSDGPRCSECDVRFVNVEALLTHLKVSPRHVESRKEDGTNDDGTNDDVGDGGRRNRQPVTCEQCNTRLPSISQYVAHFKEQHPGCARAQYLKTVLCHLCGKFYPTKYQLSLHMNTHTKAVTYTCDYCGRTHTNRLRFVRHIKSHRAVPRSCPICQKVFKSYSNMLTHKKLHSDVRNEKCQYCGKSFKEKRTLKYHIDYVHFHKPRPKCRRVRRRTQQDGVKAVAARTEGVMESDEPLLESEEYVTEIGEQVVIGYESNDDFEDHNVAVLLEEEVMHSPSMNWS